MLDYLTAFLGPKELANWSDPLALPNLAQDVSGLPPSFITVAGHDPLHDDGVIFHAKLQGGGRCRGAARGAGTRPFLLAGPPCEQGCDGGLQGDRRGGAPAGARGAAQSTVTRAPIFTWR